MGSDPLSLRGLPEPFNLHCQIDDEALRKIEISETPISVEKLSDPPSLHPSGMGIPSGVLRNCMLDDQGIDFSRLCAHIDVIWSKSLVVAVVSSLVGCFDMLGEEGRIEQRASGSILREPCFE